MVIDSTFEVQVNIKNQKHYNKKGYKCSVGDIITMSWNDVPSYYNITCECDKCDKQYIVKKSTLQNQKHPGLCKSCASQINHNLDSLIGKKFGKLTVINLHKHIPGKEVYWESICDCGNKKITSTRSLRTNKTTSCGCYRKEIIQNVIVPKLIEKNKKCIGENHPNWDSTKSNKERFTIRKNIVSYLRKEAFERDNYTCQCCSKRDGSVLNAHHIMPFSKNIDLRYELSNLITLCYNCHKQYHKEYKQNINLETLNKFKSELQLFS